MVKTSEVVSHGHACPPVYLGLAALTNSTPLVMLPPSSGSIFSIPAASQGLTPVIVQGQLKVDAASLYG